MWRPPAEKGRCFSSFPLFLINLVDEREGGKGERKKEEEGGKRREKEEKKKRKKPMKINVIIIVQGGRLLTCSHCSFTMLVYAFSLGS